MYGYDVYEVIKLNCKFLSLTATKIMKKTIYEIKRGLYRKLEQYKSVAFECKVVIINPDVNEHKVCYILNRYLVMYI